MATADGQNFRATDGVRDLDEEERERGASIAPDDRPLVTPVEGGAAGTGGQEAQFAADVMQAQAEAAAKARQEGNPASPPGGGASLRPQGDSTRFPGGAADSPRAREVSRSDETLVHHMGRSLETFRSQS